eukprot:2692497-Prymnesium_polylepis.1
MQTSPAFHQYEQTLLDELDTIIQAVPREVVSAAPYAEPVDGQTVHIINEEHEINEYADVEATELGS